MEVKIYNNIFEDDYTSFEYNISKPLLDEVEKYLDKDVYKNNLIECYDSETQETFYAPIESSSESPVVLIMVNGRSVNKEYQPKEEDNISIIYLPASGDGGWDWQAALTGALEGALVGLSVGGPWGALGGAITEFFVAGFTGNTTFGWLAVGLEYLFGKDEDDDKEVYNDKKQGSRRPDVRGAENQSLKGNNFPFVIGKHLVSPFVIGDPVTEYSGERGENAYIRTLLCVGYSPLKLTDFKLGDFWLAYNRDSTDINGNILAHPTVINGLLRGYSTQIVDDGDILDYWKNNDISLEIIQQDPNTNVNYGTIYTEYCDDQKLDANVMYIADKALNEAAKVTYKGISFPNKFRTNGVFFTASCPREFTITLQFPSGVYENYSKTSDKTTEQKYKSLPLWLCVQWRVFNNTNPSSDATGGDYDNWNTIDIGRTAIFNQAAAQADKDKHKGNDFGGNSLSDIYMGFYGKTLQNFEYLSGEDGISEFRVSATVTLTKEQCKEVLADTNPAKIIEVRVLRVSPNYINMSSNEGLPEKEGLHSYSDIVKVVSIATKTFNETELIENDVIVPVKPLSERDMRKFCLLAIRAKADESGYLVNQLKKLNCVAESFSPYWDITQKKMFPENVTKKVTYYGYYDPITGDKVNRSNEAEERVITKSEYEEGRQEGYSWYKEDNGSTYGDIIKNIVFDNSSIRNGRPCTVLSQAAIPYLNNSVSSGFMLCCVGLQNGPIALGYDEINILSIGDWAEKTAALKDGTTFNADTTYNGVSYRKGDEVPIRMEANGYVYQGTKIEDLLQKIAMCGRASWCVDESGKIKIIMDYPVDYVKGVVTSQTCLSSQNSFSFETLPAGFFISFSDENDGYETNQFYCWSDGNSIDNYHGEVEPYQINFVTNPYQMWSIARYMLAYKLMTRECLTYKIGPEGVLYSLGDVVMVQSEDLLIGETSGRICELIEDSGVIYGFISDVTYEYTGELDEDNNSVQGVSILQPNYLGKSKVVTLPLSQPRSITIGERTYTLKKGTTNVVLFGRVNGVYGIARSSDDPSDGNMIKYNMKVGDICMYGLIDKISAPYRIIRIKPERDGCFTETLVPYNEGMYNAGKELPSFQNYITYPPTEDLAVSLSDVPTNIKEFNDAQQDVLKRVSEVENGDSQAPDKVLNVTAVANELGINIKWSPLHSDGLFNTVKKYIVEISKDSGTTWDYTQDVYTSSFEYKFNRNSNADGYPEASVFSTWRVRVKVQNVYGVDSEYSDIATINTLTYGTWRIPEVTLKKSIENRTVVITAVYGTPERTLYGKLQTLVRIKRLGNEDEQDGRTFNQILNVEPDLEFYTPEFEASVHYDSESQVNEELNYKTNDKSTTPYISDTYVIAHELPLMGQTSRIFKQGNIMLIDGAVTVTTIPVNPSVGDKILYLGENGNLINGKYYVYTGNDWNEIKYFTKDVPDVFTLPVNPKYGDVIHWIEDPLENAPNFETEYYYLFNGDATLVTPTGNENPSEFGWYVLSNNNYVLSEDTTVVSGTDYYTLTWEQVFAKFMTVPTKYQYEVVLTNESGYSTVPKYTIVEALCTNISDIVHSHEHYKDFYVEKLSAISANIGLISQGGMGSFVDALNYWALSDMSAEDSGVAGGIKKGAFRVGGRDQYFLVEPSKTEPDKYTITLRAGNINLTTEQGKEGFVDGTFIYEGEPEIATKRMALTSTGIVAQQLENGNWRNKAKVQIDGSGNLIVSNSKNDIEFGFRYTNASIYHFDTVANLDENNTNVYNINCVGELTNTNELNPILPSIISPKCFSGTIEKDISGYIGNVLCFTKASGIEVDRMLNIDGTQSASSETYNSIMREEKGQGTVGSYLGLTASQISSGIFESVQGE